MMEVIQQGAEAVRNFITVSRRIYEDYILTTEQRIYYTPFHGAPAITKHRFKKTYRHPTLDAKLTRSRLIQEARCLRKARSEQLDTPYVYFVDLENMCICMEYIPGVTVKQWLQQGDRSTEQLAQLYKALGISIAHLHNSDIIHGDLTTSNVIIRSATDDNRDTNILQICLIDFGLAYSSTLHEDKAVDLYVLERAVKSTHPAMETEMIEGFIAAYMDLCRQSKQVMDKLEDVRMRGRKQSMIG